ncbi:MAG: S1C family serine protease [Nocardioidaceae bacterium]
MNPQRRLPRVLLSVAAVAALAATGGCASGSSGGGAASGTSSSPSAASSSSASSGSASGSGSAQAAEGGCPGSVPDMVQQVEPSVVTIRTQKGLGSGIAYRDDVVITDQHVVAVQEGQPQTVRQVTVALADGSTRKGTVIGSDLPTDLAVVRVEGGGLPALPFSSTLPRQGETVLAMGSPLGFSSSVTEGIVSAIGRDLPASSSAPPLVDLIQTDAPISPGNSGGALLDTCGRVVGVNEAYIPPSSGAVALGFATPAVVATHIADQLIAHGQAQHPYLGVRIQDLTPRIAQALKTGVKQGVVVVSFESGSPAAKGGIERGDVIVALDGHQVADYADLLGELRGTTPGKTAHVTVVRDGQKKTLTVTVGARDGQ